MSEPLNKYRVFINYSHDDVDLAKQIVKRIKSNKLIPFWDEELRKGKPFSDQLKAYIAHSHVFLPIITRKSSAGGWVHQEIGYAKALLVPILPVCVGKVPGEMIAGLEAVVLEDVNDEALLKQELRKKLSRKTFDEHLESEAMDHGALFECAQHREQRNQMMTRYANEVIHVKHRGILHQSGGLSSLHIPKESIVDQVWRDRYGKYYEIYGELYLKNQRKERIALEKHARKAGYRLIVNPRINFNKEYGPKATFARLTKLLEFLESDNQPKICQVVFNDKSSDKKKRGTAQSVTFVGDWFVAESISGEIGKGYSQTNFTRHTPYIKERLDDFNSKFDSLLKVRGWTAENSRERAIAELKKIIRDIS